MVSVTKISRETKNVLTDFVHSKKSKNLANLACKAVLVGLKAVFSLQMLYFVKSTKLVNFFFS